MSLLRKLVDALLADQLIDDELHAVLVAELEQLHGRRTTAAVARHCPNCAWPVLVVSDRLVPAPSAPTPRRVPT